jgi:hypothetical protein
MLGNYRVNAQLVASRAALSSTELVSVCMNFSCKWYLLAEEALPANAPASRIGCACNQSATLYVDNDTAISRSNITMLL